MDDSSLLLLCRVESHPYNGRHLEMFQMGRGGVILRILNVFFLRKGANILTKHKHTYKLHVCKEIFEY